MKKILLHTLLYFFSITSFCQNQTTNLKLQKNRLLIQNIGIYLHSVNQGSIDIDSAMILACKAQKIPYTLVNDEGYNDGTYFPGNDLITNNFIRGAELLLPRLKTIEQIKLALQISNAYLFRAGTKTSDMQNALLYIIKAQKIAEKTKIPKWIFETKLLLAKYHFQAKNTKLSSSIFAELVKTARKTKKDKLIAEAIENQGTFMPNDNPKKAVILAEAMQLYKKLDDKEKELVSLMKIIPVHFWTGNMELAKQECLTSLKLQKKVGLLHTQYTETTISYIELLHNNLRSSLYYALKSVKSMENTKDYAFADSFYIRLGNIYNQTGYCEDALKFYQKGIEFNQKEINAGTWYKSFFGAVRSLMNRDKYSEALNYLLTNSKKYPPKNNLDNMILNEQKAICYERLGRLKEAEFAYQKMEFFSKKLTSSETIKDIANSSSMMALFYTKINKPEKAREVTDRIIAITKKNAEGFNRRILELSLFKIDSLNGDYFSSIKHFENYTILQDSMDDIIKNREYEVLKFQFETTAKEQNIKLLKKQSNLQIRELHTSKLLNIISISSLFLLLVIIILLYNRSKIKQKNNIRLEQKEKEINLKNIKLQRLVEEKEWLLKEIHHRVKNNLQTVISLLNSQSNYLKDDLAINTIKNSQNRIYAMSLIHQKLYRENNLSTIDMPEYCNELVDYLKESFHSEFIHFELNIDPIELDISQAIALGLIINEVVTNSIKYAFKDKENCEIKIALLNDRENYCILIISDNGIGIADISELEHSSSFGMTLIKGLSETLEGTLSIENKNGVTFKLTFEKEINQTSIIL
ncbi:hypothetical protein HYN56_16675 [Flavobacterium crocinum]|uniref:histidine kinase n=1 Tax=Flavobacterium crocinum TaxID=2183896 RepID=A0A2S1YNX0_9FLAO|nr:sensor histidine kinase [Flavobacterium crocinum]AWK05779.1 hypothetical protein HYN56_16675 [Flavobacterium crocinum]